MMAASHLNVLHWHATDDESWPLCLDALPGACETQTYRDPWGRPANYGKPWVEEFVRYGECCSCCPCCLLLPSFPRYS